MAFRNQKGVEQSNTFYENLIYFLLFPRLKRGSYKKEVCLFVCGRVKRIFPAKRLSVTSFDANRGKTRCGELESAACFARKPIGRPETNRNQVFAVRIFLWYVGVGNMNPLPKHQGDVGL